MAKVIPAEGNVRSETISYSVQAIALLGALLGLGFWLLSTLLNRFIIEPIICQSSDTLICAKSISMSGDVATILIAAIGIMLMISLKMVRPLIISVSSAAVLWGLSVWTSSLGWVEAIFWSVILYTIAYVLFSWIARYLLIKPVLVVMLLIIVAARIATVL